MEGVDVCSPEGGSSLQINDVESGGNIVGSKSKRSIQLRSFGTNVLEKGFNGSALSELQSLGVVALSASELEQNLNDQAARITSEQLGDDQNLDEVEHGDSCNAEEGLARHFQVV